MRRYFEFIKGYISKYKFKLILTCIISMISMVFVLANPLVTRLLIDKILVDKNIQILNIVVIGVICFTVLNSIIHFIYSYFLNKIFLSIGLEIKNNLYNHILSLEYLSTVRMSVGEINYRIYNDSDLLKQSVGQIIFGGIYNALLLVVVIAYMFFINPILAIFVIMLNIIQVPLINIFTKKIRQISYERKKLIEGTMNRTIEVIGSFHLFKVCNAEKVEYNKFKKSNTSILDKQVTEATLNLVFTELSNLIVGFIGLGSIWIGSNLIFSGLISIGELMSFILVANMLNAPISSIISVILGFQDVISSTERVEGLLDLKYYEKHIENENSCKFEYYNKIVFKDIKFSYNKGVPTLSNINIELRHKTINAIVGKSGAGKTTLCLLLARLLKPDFGKITLDNRNILEINLNEYRKNVGIVLQNSFLFSGTIKENILIGKENATEEEIIEATKLANADKFISSLEDGYYTQIGSNRRNLSGGQLQRVALARVFLQKPKIVILDEPTSFIDAESEELIQDSIKKLKEYSTVIVISHKLNTVKNSDKIIVVDNGTVIESGTHDELMKNNSKYFNMHRKILG